MSDWVQHLIALAVVAACTCVLVLRIVRSGRAKPGCGCVTCPKKKAASTAE